MAKKKKKNNNSKKYPPYGFGPGFPGPAGFPGPDGAAPFCPPWGAAPAAPDTPEARAWMAAMAAQGRSPYAPSQSWTSGWLDFQNQAYVKGMIVGALAATVVANPTVQKKTMQSLASAWGLLQGGIEEMKERFRDMEAEMQAASRGAGAPDEDL